MSRSRHRTLVRLAAAGALAMGVAACAGGAGNARVTVPAGASLRLAADSLKAAGVIGSAKLFSFYAKVTGRDRRIKAGTYILDRGASWNEVVNALAIVVPAWPRLGRARLTRPDALVPSTWR